MMNILNSDALTIISTSVPMGSFHKFVNHTLIYVYDGMVKIDAGNGNIHILYKGDCAFIKAGTISFLEMDKEKEIIETIRVALLSLQQSFLCDFFLTLHTDKKEMQTMANESIEFVKLRSTPEIESLFCSLLPYEEAHERVPTHLVRMKMAEGVYALLNSSSRMYFTLFENIIRQKIGIMDIVNGSAAENFVWKPTKVHANAI